MALLNNEFRLFYQPLVNLRTGELESFEALLRWEHPVQGLLAPDQFLQIAEETNLLVSIGQFVLGEAARQLAQWRREGIVGDAVRMGVNVSARQFYDPDFVNRVHAALVDGRLPADNFILELTEDALLADSVFIKNRLQGLRDMGIHIAIDDFGTGYSSLAYLRSFPVDFIKIDKAFVHELCSEVNDSDLMIRSIVGLGHNLNLRVVAEGIQAQQQLVRVHEAGCDIGQGYLIARPMAAGPMRDYLAGVNGNRLIDRPYEVTTTRSM